MRHFEYATVMEDGVVTIVTINRPEAMNSLHEAANLELTQIFDEFEADSGQQVAILTGSGDRAFSAGNDLKSTWSSDGPESLPNGFAGISWRHGLSKPVIAAVNGVAFGGGFEAALACDVIVAARNAVFALSEPRVGLAALGGGLYRLPLSIGLHRAMNIILTGRRVSAAEGYDLGFVAEVTETGKSLEASLRWARVMCECSPQSLRASKQAVHHGLDRPFPDWCRSAFELPEVKAMMSGTERLEGARAFTEKRPPRWRP